MSDHLKKFIFVNRLIDSVWTIVCQKIDARSFKLLKYSRDIAEGYERERQFPKATLIESDDRTVTGIRIEGQGEFSIVNQQNVFSYDSRAVTVE